MTVGNVQAAEIRVVRALRLIALILAGTEDDMGLVTQCGVPGPGGMPPDIWEVQGEAWNRVQKLLQQGRGVITSILDDSGPAFENAADLAEKCEAVIKELEDGQRLARSLRFTKRLAEDAQALELRMELTGERKEKSERH